MMLHASVVMDVTDVSTTVARFRYDTNGAATIVGDTTLNKTYFQYLRVGST
jgi:type II secretory pathway component HofQ